MHKSKNMVILQTVAQHLNFLQESENSTPFSACTVHFEELWVKKIIGKSLRKYLKVSNKFDFLSTIYERNCYHYRISQTCKIHR